MTLAMGKSMSTSGAGTPYVIPIRRVYPAGATGWDNQAPIPDHEPSRKGRPETSYASVGGPNLLASVLRRKSRARPSD